MKKQEETGKTGRNGKKRDEWGRNRKKWKETERNGKKQKNGKKREETGRNGKK